MRWLDSLLNSFNLNWSKADANKKERVVKKAKQRNLQYSKYNRNHPDFSLKSKEIYADIELIDIHGLKG